MAPESTTPPPSVAGRTLLREKYYAIATAAILLAGIFLRVNRFMFNRSLWLDEAALALNIIERTPTQLVGPLSYGQAAPVGFLILVKQLTMVLGLHESVLRLIPLLSAIASLPLFHRLARKVLPARAAVAAFVVFAVSDTLGDYSAQFKQYSSDVLITLGLLLLAIWFWEAPASRKRYAVLAAAGTIAVWFSHPAAIVLAGIGVSLFLLSAQHRLPKGALPPLGLAACWLASFAVTFLLSLRSILQTQSLLGFWDYRGGFLPMPPTAVSEIEDSIGILTRAFENPLGFALYSGVALLFAVGVGDAVREGGVRLFLVSPLVVTVGLSGLRLYPFADRLLLFAVPLMLVLLLMGMVRLFEALPMRSSGDRILAAAVFGVIMFQPVRNGLARGLRPRELEEMRPLIQRLQVGYREGDVVAVYYAAQFAYEYYSRLVGFSQSTPVVIRPHGDEPGEYQDEVEQLRGHRRVWVVFSHKGSGPWGAEEPIILGYLNRMGQQERKFEETGASLYLYNLETFPTRPPPG